MFELAAHKRTLESLFHEGGGFEHDLLRRLSSLGAPDGALTIAPALAAPARSPRGRRARAWVPRTRSRRRSRARRRRRVHRSRRRRHRDGRVPRREEEGEDARAAGLAALGIETRRDGRHVG